MMTDLAQVAAGDPGEPRDVFAGLAFATPWRRLAVLELGAHERYVAAASGEAGYLVLAGEIRVQQGDAMVMASAPAAVRCAVGVPHVVTAGTAVARLVAIDVASADKAGGTLAAEPCARARLPWRDAIHGGGGRIGTRHLWGPQDFVSSWTFVDHAVLAGGSSLGHHYHDHLEECFVVLAGRGWMTIGDSTRAIGPGTVTWHPANVGHGLHNPFDEELDFIRVAVAAPGQPYTTIDLDDDLRSRRPTPEIPT